jgi:hypothetical protein
LTNNELQRDKETPDYAAGLLGDVGVVCFSFHTYLGDIFDILSEIVNSRTNQSQEAGANYAQRQREKKRHDDYWCHMQRACSNYARLRNECAVAGDFTNCLHVRMGDDWNIIGQCMDNGNLTNPPDDIPNIVLCWFGLR